ncbi:MAG: DUF1501 domain-containing protein [Planctomycetes bacterium]|nr:DUF1501 domain-containing protein [Planctomycetota bacterium]
MFDPITSQLTRRHFFGRTATGVGVAALAELLGNGSRPANAAFREPATSPAVSTPSLAAAKRIIYVFLAGGPSQVELFDHKPDLQARHGQELPRSVIGGQRLTGFTSGQKSFTIAAPAARFAQCGESGTWVSELLPELGRVADELCMVRSMYTEAVNHDPAVTFLLTGAQQAGRPSLGAWLSYGIGSENSNLPAFVVLLNPGQIQDAATPLSARHWGSGFLPSVHQGVKFRAGADPVLYLANPPGIDRATRREMIDVAAQLNAQQHQVFGDPEIATRIAQYEMAFRMQASVPELTDLSTESDEVFELYGPASRTPGTFAANCLLARRLVESGVRFVQVFDRDWDHHRNAPQHLRTKTAGCDRPLAGLIRDLKRRGMLEDTLVVCGGEFGRTIYSQGPLLEKFGRDHHGGCFTVWMAGGGVRRGMVYGATDEFSFNIVENPVHVHDLNATILHCLGIDHERLTFQFQGRHHRLTDVHGRVMQGLLSG